MLLFHFILFAHSYTSIRKARNYKNKRWRTNGKLWIECALEFLMKRFTNNLRSKAIFKQGNKLNFTIKWTNYIGNLLGCTWTIFSFLLFYYLLPWNSNAFFLSTWVFDECSYNSRLFEHSIPLSLVLFSVFYVSIVVYSSIIFFSFVWQYDMRPFSLQIRISSWNHRFFPHKNTKSRYFLLFSVAGWIPVNKSYLLQTSPRTRTLRSCYANNESKC